MYITTADPNDKYRWLGEGTYVQNSEWVPDAGNTLLVVVTIEYQ